MYMSYKKHHNNSNNNNNNICNTHNILYITIDICINVEYDVFIHNRLYK